MILAIHPPCWHPLDTERSLCTDRKAANKNQVDHLREHITVLKKVPPFKAVLMETMPNIDVLFVSETEAAKFTVLATRTWEVSGSALLRRRA